MTAKPCTLRTAPKSRRRKGWRCRCATRKLRALYIRDVKVAKTAKERGLRDWDNSGKRGSRRMVFGALTKHLVRLAVPYITLEDAKERHSRRKHLASQFDFAAIRRDWDAGNISHECKNWLDLMIMTEAGTPVYTSMLTALEDANRPEFESFRRFVLEVWNREEEEHGECAIELAKAMRMDFDPESVRDKADWAKGYFDACPPCKRVLGTTVYTVIQEEMTYHSHRAYAECSGSAELARMGQAIAAEERYHSYFYASRLRDVLAVVQKDGMSEDEA